MKPKIVAFLLLINIVLISGGRISFAHGLIYETSQISGNKLRVTLKWSTPGESKGISTAYYHIKNGKDLNIGYELKDGAPEAAYIDISLASTIPPLKITLTDINDVNAVLFDDIKGIEAEEYIRHLHDAGIVNGRGGNLFKPEDTLTRAEFMVLVVKALNLSPNTANVKDYSDIKNHWARDIILTASENGLISGYKDGTVKPDSPITLAEVSTVISRAFSFKTTFNGIYDKLRQEKWYSDRVKKMFDVGILKTSDSIYAKFDEESYISRANCAMMISRAISTY